MKSNKKILAVALLLTGATALAGCSSSSDSTAPPSPPIGDINGSWSIAETYTSKTAGCSGLDNYSYTAVQNGATVTITDNSGNAFKATLSGNKLAWSSSVTETDNATGVTSVNTATTTATIGANCSSLTATSTWTYTDDQPFSCSGSSTITGTRTSGGNSC